MFFLIYWGRLADRIGRKPVLLITSIGTALFMSAFGCSTTLWEMFLYRGLVCALTLTLSTSALTDKSRLVFSLAAASLFEP